MTENNPTRDESVRQLAAELRRQAEGYVDDSGCMKGNGIALDNAADALEAQSARIAKLEEALKAYVEADSYLDDNRGVAFQYASTLARRALTETK